MERIFILTASFERSWQRMGLDDEDLRALESLLLSQPEAGDVIQGLSGARKVRIPLEGRGKSGGGRVIYVDVVLHEQIYLLLAYPKNVQTDLTAEQRKIIQQLIDKIREE